MSAPNPRTEIGDAAAKRQANMAILAQALPEAIAARIAALETPDYSIVRKPETGLVMVRGRTGGTGNPFNLGEVTVTRCVVRLQSGETGSAYSLGRNKAKALQSALIDALWQHPDHREKVETQVLAPLVAAQTHARATVSAETAATKVNFFTMVRGDD